MKSLTRLWLKKAVCGRISTHNLGAVLTLVSVFLPFKMIAPGAMMIGGQMPSAKNYLKISIAGVITNMILQVRFWV